VENASQGGGGPLHPDTISHVFQKLSVKAGLRIKRGPHAFRNFAPTHVAEKTGDVWLVRDYLGHSSTTMAEQYVHRSDRRIAKQIRRASPLEDL
jgi:integrase